MVGQHRYTLVGPAVDLLLSQSAARHGLPDAFERGDDQMGSKLDVIQIDGARLIRLFTVRRSAKAKFPGRGFQEM